MSSQYHSTSVLVSALYRVSCDLRLCFSHYLTLQYLTQSFVHSQC